MRSKLPLPEEKSRGHQLAERAMKSTEAQTIKRNVATHSRPLRIEDV